MDKEFQSDPHLSNCSYNVVREGKAEVLFPKSVFYNPVQEFNRDLTIAAISVFGLDKKFKEELKQEQALKQPGNDRSTKIERKAGLLILEGLAASGLRSVRFAKEIPYVSEIVANDFDKNAVSFITKNIEKNSVGDVMTSSNDDAAMVMYRHRAVKDRFDVVDLDPYGSPAVFLDSAVQSVSDGGLLCVTCTDTAVLCGNASETCYAKYGAVSLRTKYCHEMALRILLQSIESHANRYSRYIVPLISVSVDFYVRVFVKIYTGQGKVKQSVSKLAMVYHCNGCGSYHLQPMGIKTPTGRNNFKYSPASGPIVGQKCGICNSCYRIGGPIWADPIHDKDFTTSVADYVTKNSEAFNTSSRIVGMLSLVKEELQDVPLYYVTSALCCVVHCISPTFIQIRSALLNAGYRVSMSHAESGSLKTDAPPSMIWDIMRCWVRENPVKQSRLIQGTPTKYILDSEPSYQADFTEHPHANPPSRQERLVRFQPNPEPEWGPRPRAKRTSNQNTDIIQATTDKRKERQGWRKALKRRNSDDETEVEKRCQRGPAPYDCCQGGEDCVDTTSHE